MVTPSPNSSHNPQSHKRVLPQSLSLVTIFLNVKMRDEFRGCVTLNVEILQTTATRNALIISTRIILENIVAEKNKTVTPIVCFMMFVSSVCDIYLLR